MTPSVYYDGSVINPYFGQLNLMLSAEGVILPLCSVIEWALVRFTLGIFFSYKYIR